ncbi:hypothetical protein GOBAR_DD28528 [Gossypium barbadense]|nr:hypothetical protein GOBAR_DD28528 [Gossypium barbadense]
MSIGATAIVSSGTGCLDTGQFMYQKGATFGAPLGNGQIENWADSGLAYNSQQTDTSTDVDADHKKQLRGVQHGAVMNREAARKSRLRKKAYVQQLENSRLRLTELEQELQRARQQGIFIASGLSGDHGHTVAGNAALAFDMEYGRWLDEHQQLINDIRLAVNSHMGDNELCVLVGGVMAYYDEVFRLKSTGAKADVFHMLSVRNRCIHERKKVTTLETTGFVRSYLRELDGLKVVLPIKPKVEELWKPPKSPFVKINFDVTFRKEEHKSCSGIVVRDSEGMVLGSRVVHNGWVALVFAVEATVCSQGLQMGLDLGAIAVRVEGDALSVIKKLQKVEEDKSEISATIKVCLWSSKGFQMCKFVNGKRSKKECVKLLMGIVLISVLMKLGEGKSFGKWKG